MNLSPLALVALVAVCAAVLFGPSWLAARRPRPVSPQVTRDRARLPVHEPPRRPRPPVLMNDADPGPSTPASGWPMAPRIDGRPIDPLAFDADPDAFLRGVLGRP